APRRARRQPRAGRLRLPRRERQRQGGDRARSSRASGGSHHPRQPRAARTVDPREPHRGHRVARRALRPAGDARAGAAGRAFGRMALMNVAPSHKIRVDVETSYLDEQSDPREGRYVFAYTITIRNEGQVPARLLTRHWVITDANGKVEEVHGDGVVGE